MTSYFTFNRTLYTTTTPSTTTALSDTSKEAEQSANGMTTARVEPLFTGAAAVATTLTQTIVKVHFIGVLNTSRANETFVCRVQWAIYHLKDSNVTARRPVHLQ